MRAAAVIFALLASVVAMPTSQNGVENDPQVVFRKLLLRFLPAESIPNQSVVMINVLVNVAFPRVQNVSKTNKAELLECQREIADNNMIPCHKLEANNKKCSKRFIEESYANGKNLSDIVQQVLDMRIDGLSALIEFACTAKPEQITGLRHDCIYEAIGGTWPEKMWEQFHDDVDKLKYKITPTKALMCEIIGNARSVLEAQLKTVCVNNDVAVKAYMDYFDAPLKPCLIQDKKP